jgi:SAM-dependent methyltransferase
LSPCRLVADRWGPVAAEYDALVAPTFTALEEHLLDLARPVPGEPALDIGCGSGLTARLLARRLGPASRIIGVDPAPGMIAEARRRSAEHPNLRFARMDAADLGFRPGVFSLATCAFAFHLVDRPERLLRAAHGLLRPGGRLALCVWGSRSRDPAAEALDTFLYPDAFPRPGQPPRRPLRAGDSGPEVRALQAALRAAGGGLTPNGIFDEITATALASFQRRAGLPPTGLAAAPTRRALEAFPPTGGDAGYRARALARPGRLAAELAAAGFRPVRVRRRRDSRAAGVEEALRLAAFWRRGDLGALGQPEREAILELALGHLRARFGPGPVVWEREVVYAIGRRFPAAGSQPA